MPFRDLRIKGKVMAVTMLTSITVLLLTITAFTLYDLATYRQNMAGKFSSVALVLARQSSPCLAAKDDGRATLLLQSLRGEPNIVAAALYDAAGELLARYPAGASAGLFPVVPEKPGSRYEARHLVLFEPVQGPNGTLGTLYLKSEVPPLYSRLRLYGGLALLVFCGSVLVALALSNRLQQRISQPILALADTARMVSERRDFGVRAPAAGQDEVGLLTDAFNQMLARIQEAERIRSFVAAIVESSDDAVIGKDLRGNVVSWNKGAERMLGYPAAEMIGQSIMRVVPPDRPEEEARILEAVKQGGIRHYETVRRRKDGHPVEVSLTASPIKNSRGDIIGISSISRDITQRKRAQEALKRQIRERKEAEELVRQMNLELEERVEQRTAQLTAANGELEAFTYSVAHDLRAPLRHIDAFARIVCEEFAAGLPPEAQQYLEAIRKGSRHMSQLVDDLLNLARVGRQEIKRRPTSLDTLVQEVLHDLKGETEGRHIEWRLHPLPSISCDPGLMKQVFANILANAIKYTRPRPLAVIEVGCMAMNGDAVLYVRDNGVGFSMKYADKLFGVFQRLHRAEEFEGTGVGLATVERIVRKHGGCVWAEAAVDKGAAFYIAIPGLSQVALPEAA